MSDAAAPDRREQHLDVVLAGRARHARAAGFDRVHFVHEALPDLDHDKIDLGADFLGRRLKAPLLICAMTGGPSRSEAINARLAEAAQHLGVALAVGLQRAAIKNDDSGGLDRTLRRRAPDTVILFSIGAAQLTRGFGLDEARRRWKWRARAAQTGLWSRANGPRTRSIRRTPPSSPTGARRPPRPSSMCGAPARRPSSSVRAAFVTEWMPPRRFGWAPTCGPGGGCSGGGHDFFGGGGRTFSAGGAPAANRLFLHRLRQSGGVTPRPLATLRLIVSGCQARIGSCRAPPPVGE